MSAQKALWEVAVDQYGYVTTNNARMLGIAPVTVRQLVQRGQLESAAHGVYRFPHPERLLQPSVDPEPEHGRAPGA